MLTKVFPPCRFGDVEAAIKCTDTKNRRADTKRVKHEACVYGKLLFN